ncbi:hypothetical protein B6N60_02290 [Richelia sinica FACHB-800]|uniref:Uncharacterized protein n=1 Tax=Richelia sinica FACHB-800 TaxID=1357546 RepID=A0A975T814_9NOST|nr:hypothetical protein B6N60_02290 [Richelia sinica FACHB-800]
MAFYLGNIIDAMPLRMIYNLLIGGKFTQLQLDFL